MSVPGQNRTRPIEGEERFLDGVDKLFSYPTEGLPSDQVESIKEVERRYENVVRGLLVFLSPCADRSAAVRELRVSYLTACDAIRLRGAF